MENRKARSSRPRPHLSLQHFRSHLLLNNFGLYIRFKKQFQWQIKFPYHQQFLFGERVNVTAEPRSAYLLSGPAPTEWEHSIPPADALRYSSPPATCARAERSTFCWPLKKAGAKLINFAPAFHRVRWTPVGPSVSDSGGTQPYV